MKGRRRAGGGGTRIRMETERLIQFDWKSMSLVSWWPFYQNEIKFLNYWGVTSRNPIGLCCLVVFLFHPNYNKWSVFFYVKLKADGFPPRYFLPCVAHSGLIWDPGRRTESWGQRLICVASATGWEPALKCGDGWSFYVKAVSARHN